VETLSDIGAVLSFAVVIAVGVSLFLMVESRRRDEKRRRDSR